jgi:hypothetical protein
MSKLLWISGASALLIVVVAMDFSEESVSQKEKEVASQPDAKPAEPAKPAKPSVTLDPELLRVEPGEYWIGVQCYGLQDELHEELGIPEDRGLVIATVFHGSPAHKAGIRRHDVVMKAGEKPLAHVKELVAVIEDSKGEELSLELLRGQQKKSVKLTPIKRPEEARPRKIVTSLPDDHLEDLDEWVDQIREGLDHGPIRLRFVQPGTIIPRGASARPPLPENLTVVITKTGAQPAKIVVKQDGQSWEATEDELDELPEKILPHVEQMLGRMPGPWIARMPVPGDLQRFDITSDWTHPAHLKEYMEEHFEKVHAKLGRLDRLFEKMQGGDSDGATGEKGPNRK